MPGDVLTCPFDTFPNRRYAAIMADPPWDFGNWSTKGRRKNPSRHYRCMDQNAIKNMPVWRLAAADCLLWLWATNPMLPQAIETLAAWGFEFKTAGHWVKTTKSGGLAMGTGYVLRSAGEPFLIGVRGRPKIRSRSVRSVLLAQRREHSRKPDDAYEAMRRLVEGPYLELFGRQPRDGWTVWGDEADRFQGGATEHAERAA